MSIKNIISWILRLAAAIILLQTLYFKFTGQPEAVAIFTKLGVEPWGRFGTGFLELVTALLLLIPATVFAGAVIGAATMAGAILSHLFVIGIESNGDGGELFILGIIVLLCCLALMLIHRRRGMILFNQLFKK